MPEGADGSVQYVYGICYHFHGTERPPQVAEGRGDTRRVPRPSSSSATAERGGSEHRKFSGGSQSPLPQAGLIYWHQVVGRASQHTAGVHPSPLTGLDKSLIGITFFFPLIFTVGTDALSCFYILAVVRLSVLSRWAGRTAGSLWWPLLFQQVGHARRWLPTGFACYSWDT